MSRQIEAFTGLRGVCAVWVLLFHLTMLSSRTACLSLGVSPSIQQSICKGAFCVNIFFVLSGFIISATYKGPYLDYMISRICRIYPLHVFVLTIMVVMQAVFILYGINNGYHYGDLFLVYTLTFMWLGKYSGFEWDWNIVTWTLSVEMLVYIIYPLYRNTLSKIGKPYFYLALAVILLVDMWASEQSEALIEGCAGFALGVVLQKLEMPVVFNTSLAALLLAGLIVMGSIFAILPTVVLVSNLAKQSDFIVVKFLECKTTKWFGKISFSLYMVHYPIITYLNMFTDSRKTQFDIMFTYLYIIGLIILIFSISQLCFHYIEDNRRNFILIMKKFLRPRSIGCL